MVHNVTVTSSPKVVPYESQKEKEKKRRRAGRGYLVVVTESTWQLLGPCGCYGSIVAVSRSGRLYGTALREGVTAA